MADFSYFDQFTDIEIDLTSYLKSIPTTGSYTFNNKQPVVTTIKNLFTKYEIVFDYKKNIDLILDYKIKDDEFIETVSYNIYGSPEYWWIIALFNDIQNPFRDWPLSQPEVIQIATNLFNTERKYSYNTYLNFVSSRNESKRDIIIPKSDTLKDIIWKYRQVIIG
jgi:hypothetical protein